MLRITVGGSELWDEIAEEFVYFSEQTICLEHSLLSISKWESKWKKPFLDDHDKTNDEILDYIKCMTITKNVSDELYSRLSNENLNEIIAYINDKKTATTISNHAKKHSGNGEGVTSEVIYYWMASFNIPFECEKWHFSRLITLLEVASVKSQPPKKMSKRELMSRNASLNAARRAKLNTKG